jgi:hypothetical protein
VVRRPLLAEAIHTNWEYVGKQDVQRWMVWLLEQYSAAYASNQFRALQQFFKWLTAEEEIPDPMAGLKPPHVPDKPVPVFTGEDLARLERACAGRSFQQRRDAGVIAVFRATGMRRSELAGIRYDPDDPRRSDVDLWHHRPRQGPQDQDRQDRPRRRLRPRQVPPRPRPARPGIPAATVARHQQPRPDDRQRHLPGHRPPRTPVRRRGVPAPVPAPTSATFGWIEAGPRAT